MNRFQRSKSYAPAVVCVVVGVLQLVGVVLISARRLTLHRNGHATVVVLADHAPLVWSLRIFLVLFAAVCFWAAAFQIREAKAGANESTP